MQEKNMVDFLDSFPHLFVRQGRNGLRVRRQNSLRAFSDTLESRNSLD